MITERQMQEYMQYVVGDDRKALEALLESFSAEDRRYFDGYIDGYVEAVRHMQMRDSETSGDGKDALQ